MRKPAPIAVHVGIARNADMNSDGKINTAEVMLIMRAVIK